MNIISLLTIFLTLPSFFKNVHRRLYEDEEISEKSELFGYLSNARRSFDRFLNNFYIVIGSSMLASIIDPDNPEEKAERIFNEFESSYRDFSADFRRLYEGILKEKGRYSAGSGKSWNISELLPVGLSGDGIDPAALMDWFASDENPYMNNERVFYHKMTELSGSFAKRELGVKDLSLHEIINDLSVSGMQLAGILGMAFISFIGTMKVSGDSMESFE